MKKLAVITTLLTSVASFTSAETNLLVFPEGSDLAFSDSEQNARVALPVSPFSDGNLTTEVTEGGKSLNVWKTPRTGTDDLLGDLRAQLEALDYEILFECHTRECGGFDFRFALDVVEEPLMHVDLGDFRYLTARQRIDEDAGVIGLLISRSPERGFVQITSVSPSQTAEPIVAVSTKLGDTGADVAPASLGDLLIEKGSAVLEGLTFNKGSSNLDGSPAQSLSDLAAFLTENPDRQVILVGHTDASGSLEGNVSLSRKRAASVVQRLVETYGVRPAQVAAEGVGYLAPRASNATEEGRDQNRRVEVVLTEPK